MEMHHIELSSRGKLTTCSAVSHQLLTVVALWGFTMWDETTFSKNLFHWKIAHSNTAEVLVPDHLYPSQGNYSWTIFHWSKLVRWLGFLSKLHWSLKLFQSNLPFSPLHFHRGQIATSVWVSLTTPAPSNSLTFTGVVPNKPLVLPT